MTKMVHGEKKSKHHQKHLFNNGYAETFTLREAFIVKSRCVFL